MTGRGPGPTVAVFTKNQTNPFFESIRVGALVDAFLDESAEIADLIAGATERAVAAEGRDAPFEPILRRALDDLGRAMPLENEPGGDLPNGAVAPISATWSRLTGRA